MYRVVTGETYPLRPPSVSTLTSTSSSLISSIAETESKSCSFIMWKHGGGYEIIRIREKITEFTGVDHIN